MGSSTDRQTLDGRTDRHWMNRQTDTEQTGTEVHVHVDRLTQTDRQTLDEQTDTGQTDRHWVYRQLNRHTLDEQTD
jgi:hypothetical protein